VANASELILFSTTVNDSDAVVLPASTTTLRVPSLAISSVRDSGKYKGAFVSYEVLGLISFIGNVVN